MDKNSVVKKVFAVSHSSLLSQLFWGGIFLLFMQTSIWAETAKETKKTNSSVKRSVSLGVNFSSTFYWRGEDRNVAMYNEERKLNFAPVLQPELTVFTPLRGLYFDLFGTFPLRGREERELKKNDQLDFSVIYDFANRIGFWSVSYALYANFYGGKNFGEIAFSYRLPFQIVNFAATQYALHSFDGSSGSLYSEVSLGKTVAQLFVPTLLLGWHTMPVGTASWGHVDLILEFYFDLGTNKNIQLKFNTVTSYRFPQGTYSEPWKFVFNAAVFYTL